MGVLTRPSRVEYVWINSPVLDALDGTLYIDPKSGRFGFVRDSHVGGERWYWQIPIDDLRLLLSGQDGGSRPVVLEFRTESSSDWKETNAVLSINRSTGHVLIRPEKDGNGECRFLLNDIESLFAEF